MRRAGFPCTLLRQDCLLHNELADYLDLDFDIDLDHAPAAAAEAATAATTPSLTPSTSNMALPPAHSDSGLFSDPAIAVGDLSLRDPSSPPPTDDDNDSHDGSVGISSSSSSSSGAGGNGITTTDTAAAVTGYPPLSLFERILTSHPPILESLLAQLPTTSVLDLSHTSGHLREFLRAYPLAWKSLSFRLNVSSTVLGGNTAGVDTPSASGHLSKPFALDKLLIQVVVPAATALRSLDLDNTGVSGLHLVSHVMQPRLGTLQHLSVRGCKNVSIKYHIVPFLQLFTSSHDFFIGIKRSPLALKSLYTYRCRHHRRRPYLPSSLQRRDSDSEPTHELIELCYELGIWTDTAWCPTPGARCFRRKDYHAGRPTPGTAEVWVPFDRL